MYFTDQIVTFRSEWKPAAHLLIHISGAVATLVQEDFIIQRHSGRYNGQDRGHVLTCPGVLEVGIPSKTHKPL